MGISLAGVFKMEGILNGKRFMPENALYPYQPEFSMLFSECFRMSFQLGAVFRDRKSDTRIRVQSIPQNIGDKS